MKNLNRDMWSVTLSGIHWRLLFYVMLIARKEFSLWERTYTFQEVSGSHIDLEEIRDMTENGLIFNTSFQPEVDKPVESNDIVVPLHKI